MKKNEKQNRYKYYIFDTETSNNPDDDFTAFFICYQIAEVLTPFEDITPRNVERALSVTIYRDIETLYDIFYKIIDDAVTGDYTAIICVHNLAFDYLALKDLYSEYETEFLSKNGARHITITLKVNDDKRLIFWDTLGFSGKSLEKMGEECGYNKAVGKWDYNLIRTPETPLTNDEIEYAKRDIYTLAAWLGYWRRLNPDLFGLNFGIELLTLTSVTRRKSILLSDKIRREYKHNINREKRILCDNERAKSDDELYTMMTATRGGFTFVSSKYSTMPIICNEDERIIGYDAISQHPAQMVSHLYPVNFILADKEKLNYAFNEIIKCDLNYILENWVQPFLFGLYARFKFTNLRLKKGSLYSKHGMATLSRRGNTVNELLFDPLDDINNQFINFLNENNKSDFFVKPKIIFGKIQSAKYAEIMLTELEAWIMSRVYQWDSVDAVSGYLATKFILPTDFDILTVMNFYKNKNEFKTAQNDYKNGNAVEYVSFAPDYINDALKNHDHNFSGDISAFYQITKAQLNALYGINITKEARPSYQLTDDGIKTASDFSIKDYPKHLKTWYQYGQRIVGWSRVAQICVMELLNPYVKKVLNGDTDSIKILTKIKNIDKINSVLEVYANAVTNAKNSIINNIKDKYLNYYDDLENIGAYESDLITDKFYYTWNKSYIYNDNGNIKMTIAGVPTQTIEKFADELNNMFGFANMCKMILNYNVCYDWTITGLTTHFIPDWGLHIVKWTVTDYTGKTYEFNAPCAIRINNSPKTVGSTLDKFNRNDCLYVNGKIDKRLIMIYNKNGAFSFEVIDDLALKN